MCCRRWRYGLLAAVSVIGVVACSNGDGGGEVDALQIEGAWSRPTPPGATNAAVYLTVVSPIDDLLEAVTVDPAVAAHASLHESVVMSHETGELGGSEGTDAEGMNMAGMTGMEELDTVAIPSNDAVLFQPGGMHIMLEDVAKPLNDGDRFQITLEFKEAGTHDVEAVVGDQAP